MTSSDENGDLFDKHASSYSSDVNDAVGFTGLDVDFFTRVKAGYIEDICNSHFGDMKTIDALDVGCGVGNFHDLLASKFGSLSGVDVSKSSIEQAEQAHPTVKYEVYDGGRLPYADASFDVAFTICVMHHVPPGQWPHFSSEFFRVLKPGGIGLVFEHNPRNPLTMRVVNRCPFDKDAVLLKEETTRGLMQKAGFGKITSRYILSVPPPNKFARRIDGIFASLPFGAQYYVKADKL